MVGIGYPDYIPYDFDTYNSIFVFEDGSKIKCSFCRMQVRRTLVWNFQPPNARVSRAIAKPPTCWASPAEQPASFQAKNAAAVASAAPFVGRAGARPLSTPCPSPPQFVAHLPLGYSLHDDFISLHKRSMDDEVQIVLRTGSKCMDFTRLYH
jgi:hypothetical protein